MFQNNVGTLDRLARMILGVILLSLTIVGPRTLWGLIGIVPFVTGFLGTCPLYSVLGISTCPRALAPRK